MKRITQQEYWNEVRFIAEEAMKWDDPFGSIFESVYSHEWVIYRFYHDQIMSYTENEDAGIGCIKNGSWSIILSAFAFEAFRADVEDCYGSL